jgi:hypothetical protein
MAVIAVTGVNFGKISSSPPVLVQGNLWGARLRAQVDIWTAVAGDIGSTIKVARVPKGAVVIPELCSISIGTAGLTASTTLQMGDSGDDDRFLSAAASTSTGKVANAINPAGVQYECPADTDIFLKLAGANNAVTTAIVTTVVVYAAP